MRLTVQKVRAETASYELSPRDWKSSSIPEGGREKKSEKHGGRSAQKLDCFEGKIPLGDADRFVARGDSHASGGCLLRGHARDLDEVLGRGQPRLHGGARGRIRGIHPGVPHGVHVLEVAHVGEPDGGGEELGLARARGGEEIVDLLQDLLGLALDVGGGIAGDLACQVDGVAMHDGGAQALARLKALDGHGVLLLWTVPLTLPSPQRGEGSTEGASSKPSPPSGERAVVRAEALSRVTR